MESIEEFVQKVFRCLLGWKNSQIKTEAVIVDPRLQNYAALSRSVDRADFGKYTLNPETQRIKFSNLKMFIPNLPEFNDAPIYMVMRYVMDTYGGKYYIPGIEYWKWLCQNPEMNPVPAMKDKNWYFFPGSMLCGNTGYWSVPFSEAWRESRKERDALWIRTIWNPSDCRIVLLEKNLSSR
ncbi:MAG: hypothetical protein V1711_01190 [bacterium]